MLLPSTALKKYENTLDRRLQHAEQPSSEILHRLSILFLTPRDVDFLYETISGY